MSIFSGLQTVDISEINFYGKYFDICLHAFQTDKKKPCDLAVLWSSF